ncbi:putative serine/threonine-protein kinase TEL1 [Triangularia verruculosa]|uniref:Serine/threonine-protein kinase Tel1 n=1 Tax=Triangularia verruculosa TaxID=2587418 RepID=A0AAN7AWX8_9PEZI|nr:putative serine/threonine-protein kinase TEL1 [Triangularia verruculosa]
MARMKSYSNEPLNFQELSGQLVHSTATQRKEAIESLLEFFKTAEKGGSQSQKASQFDDKSYHSIYEALFRCTVLEKENYFTSKKSARANATASARLEKCAEALRMAVRHGASRIKRKTARAIIDHITQILQGPDDSYIAPLLKDYVKALCTFLQNSANVENLSAFSGESWDTCVDFCVEALSRYLEAGDRDSGSRASPAPTLRASSVAISSQGSSQIGSQIALDFLSCLNYLVAAPNAPVLRRASKISNVILQILQLRQMKIGELQKVAFSALNSIFVRTQTDDIALSKRLVMTLTPLLSHWWQPRALSRDAMLNSIRDEMLKTIYASHLYVESILRESADESFVQDLEELLDALWSDYSRREERARLQLDDITFTGMALPTDHPTTGVFSLRPYNTAGEQNWALLENLAILEAIYARHSQRAFSQQEPENGQPRKRRRVVGTPNRIHRKITSLDPAVQLTALQLMPFLCRQRAPSLEEAAEAIADLSKCVTAKQGVVTSWAMIACSSLAPYKVCRDASLTHVWKQLWQLAVRSLSLSPTARAASVFLGAVIRASLIPRHELADDVNHMVTTADISGPAILVDSSLTLMLSLLRLRNSMSPNTSQVTANHIIRWVFVKWNPAELTYASLHSIHAAPSDLVNLLRVCVGMPSLGLGTPLRLFGGSIAQFWKKQSEALPSMRYLLLLQDEALPATTTLVNPPLDEQEGQSKQTVDPTGSHTAKRLILELLYPKLEELHQITESWQKRGSEGVAPVPISADRLQSMVLACLTGAILLPELANLNTSMSKDLETALFEVVDGALRVILAAPQIDDFFRLVLTSVVPFIPPFVESQVAALRKDQPHLLKFYAKLSVALQEKAQKDAFGRSMDAMDLDDEFESQSSHSSSTSKGQTLVRRDNLLCHTPEAFYLETTLRIHYLEIIRQDEGQLGHMPEALMEQLLSLEKEQLLTCRAFMKELFSTAWMSELDTVIRVIETIGGIISENEFSCCEVALCTCIDVMNGFIYYWTDKKLDQEIGAMVGDLYHYLVKRSLPNNSMSPAAQGVFSGLLFHIMEVCSNYAQGLGLPSARSTLLGICLEGEMETKYEIAKGLPGVFALYVLKTHDDIFLDVLDNLPTDPEIEEGIAYRLFVLAELACRWPTLLRRCIYHIFETPGRVVRSVRYAGWCLRRISEELKLSGPEELFRLFAPQLLYTWLEKDSIEDIPFEIFGFKSLQDLLAEGQTEAAAIMMMRDQEEEALDVAKTLGMTPQQMVTKNFTKIIAYSTANDLSRVPEEGQTRQITGEKRLVKILTKEGFLEQIHLNFADIIATFFAALDQEGSIEKAFRRVEGFSYAADIMDTIKDYGHLPTVLPPSQQPCFRVRYLPLEILHLLSRTPYELHSIWTPALVVFIARKLLNTIHPALGPLHACSVLRKIRVLVCLAGPTALTAYPLEMLLHSIRAFVVDPECADDALGITQYLIVKGSDHLSKAPSFFAGYALSSLADLRVFLESSQSSTTQESQFRATKSKAQVFHDWFGKYLKNYESKILRENPEHLKAFKAITQSAAEIRAMGNAERGTNESNLLMEILKDWDRADSDGDELLNEPARGVALRMLCGQFWPAPKERGLDVIGEDEEAVRYKGVVWKSCVEEGGKGLSGEYLAWAGRVIGRGFAASGEIPRGLLKESRLEEYKRLSCKGPKDAGSSEEGLLNLMEQLTVSGDCLTAGLAEAALRTVYSDAAADQFQELVAACQRSLSEALADSLDWEPFRTPASDVVEVPKAVEQEVFRGEKLESGDWAKDLTTLLAQAVPDDITLRVLPPILTKVKGFAEQAFPFVVHLVLTYQLDKQQGVKRQLSEAMKEWLTNESGAARENLKLLLNTILYLRTQPLSGEASIADRAHWLEVNLTSAAAAATRCGMYKVALLFAELASSEVSRASRRSSAIREAEDSSEILLDIFENIDDPDAYYGLTQDASLSTVLARLEYENDGSKSLAFRGAQYDSHLRSRDAASRQDGQALIKALSSLGLAGLSNSLLQTQQSLDESSNSLDSTFTTARRLEMWNLPAPVTNDNWAVTVYKAYQSMHQASDIDAVRGAIHDGLKGTIRYLTSKSLNTTSMRHQLGVLAALAELDDVLCVTDPAEMKRGLQMFEARSKWMMSGRYEDVSQILSCRETTLSMWSQHHKLRAATIPPADAQFAQIKGLLLSSDIFRFHRAHQETLNLSTTLTDLIKPSEAMGLNVDAAIRMEAANSLWDQGEMISSIRMLQAIDKDSSLKKQTIPVSRSDLLSKIGFQVSVARLESPDSTQKKYLEPALKELRGKNEGKEAGQVFHQFAMFCDEQLQNPDSLEDLARLQNLKKGKNDEVEQLKQLISKSKDSQTKSRYSSHLAKARQWLDLDQQELRRLEQSRADFVELSLENYLLSLAASDEHNNDALRFTALWLERSEEDATNEAVKKYIGKVPTRKFAPLMNQLSSRLQDQKVLFQNVLIDLIYRICVDHPYHGMYQIWSGARTKVNKDDDVAVSRQKATDKVARALTKAEAVSAIWPAIDQTSRVYHMLAMDRDTNRFKQGSKIPIKDSQHGQPFLSTMSKYKIPPPTMQMELSPTCDYSQVPMIVKFDPHMAIASGVSAPKILTAIGSDGRRYKQLVKGGNDDLRQDAIMEQVFAAVSELLKLHRTTRQRNLGIRTYKVLPLTSSSGLIEFVSNTIPLHEYLMPAHEKYYPKDLKGSQCRKEISAAQTKTTEHRIAVYRKVTEKFHPVMRYFFMEYFPDPDEWFHKRTAYTRTTAAISMLGHVLGLGDRHGHNILLDTKTGEVVHIDLGVAFEMGRVLPVPELVPFRLTRDIVDGMGITKTEGVFRRCCEFTLDALREEAGSIQTVLDSLRFDTLYQWSISPVRMAKLQQNARLGEEEENEENEEEVRKQKGNVNEPSEADRAIEVVKKKLSKTLSVMATVNDLIEKAGSVGNLAVLYSGWAAYA